jgi:hypothetical protein
LTIETESRKALNDALNRNLSFQAGNRHSGAGVAASRERKMWVRGAAYVEPIRLGKTFRIAIRRPNAQVQVRAGLQQSVSEFHRLDDEPVTELVWTFITQNLLDGGVDQGCVSPQPVQLILVSKEQVQGVADEIRRRFVPGVQKKHAIVQQLGLADRLRDESSEYAIVVPRPRNQCTQVRQKVSHCRVAALLLVRGEHRLERAENC